MLPKPHKSGGVDKLTPIPLKQEQKYSVTYRQCLCKTGTIQQCQTFITETCLCSVAQKPLIIPATNTPQLFVSFFVLFCFVLFVCSRATSDDTLFCCLLPQSSSPAIRNPRMKSLAFWRSCCVCLPARLGGGRMRRLAKRVARRLAFRLLSIECLSNSLKKAIR